MTLRNGAWFVMLAALALAWGCDDPQPEPQDAGMDAGGGIDAGPRMDAGMDAGPPPMDAGPPDSGPPDGGPPDGGDVPLTTFRVEEICAPAFVPCGGTIADGTYYVQDICIDERPLVGDAAAGCDGYFAENATGHYTRGTVTFSSGEVTRDLDIAFGVDLNFPSDCFVPMNAGCRSMDMQRSLPQIYDSVDCVRDTDSRRCICHVEFTSAISQTESYSTAANQITFATEGSTHAYCVDGADVRHGDLGMLDDTDPTIFRLTPLL